MTLEEVFGSKLTVEQVSQNRLETNRARKEGVMHKVIGFYCKKCQISLDEDRYHGPAWGTKCYDCFREMMNEPARKKKQISRSSPEEFIRYKARLWSATAMQRNIVYQLDADYLVEMYDIQNGICLYTSNVLQVSDDTNYHTYLTLDRLDSRLGYIKGNVAFCSRFYNNRIKKDISLEWFELFAPSIYNSITDMSNGIFTPCVFDTKKYQDLLDQAKQDMLEDIRGIMVHDLHLL